MVHTTPKNPHNTQTYANPPPQPQRQRYRPLDYLREPPTAPRLHRPPTIHPPTPSRSLAHCAPGSLPFAPFTPAMAHLKYPPAQMLFVKNVPTEYTTHVTTLFRAFEPLEMKNLYPLSAITTLMVALPSEEAADAALLRTNEIKVGTALISVERYNARQSVIARRETRRGRGEGFVGEALGAVVEGKEDDGEEEDDKMQWPVLGGGKEVDGEVEKPVLGKMASRVMGRPITAARKGEKVKWTSWANIAADFKAVGESPSSASSVLLLTPSNDSEILEAKLSSSDDEQGVADSPTETLTLHENAGLRGQYSPPLIGSAIARPAVKPGYWLPPISGLDLPAPTTATPTSSKLPLPTWSPHLPPSSVRPPPGFPRLPAHSGGKSPARSTFGAQTEGLSMPVDTTRYIQERHCAGCSLCDLLKSRKVYE